MVRLIPTRGILIEGRLQGLRKFGLLQLPGDDGADHRAAGLGPVAVVKPDEDDGHVVARVFPVPANRFLH